MIEVKLKRQIRKGTKFAGGSVLSTSSPGGDYASRAGYAAKAGHAETADESQLALRAKEADHAAKADRADIAHDLDEDSPVNKRFISRLHNDTAVGHVTFKQGIDSGKIIKAEGGVQFGKSYAPGLTGFGGLIDGDGHGELRSLILNEWLEVPELRFNRVDVSTGTEWHAPGGGLIESVETDGSASDNSGWVSLHLEAGEAGAVAAGDLCMGIWHFSDPSDAGYNSDVDLDDNGNFKFKGFATVYFQITEVNSDASRFRYRLREGYSIHPQPGMYFVGYTNIAKNTKGTWAHPERQKSRYSTRTYERYLSGVTDWTFRPANIAAQFGDLSNLSLGNGIDLRGYSAYLQNVYMTGRFHNIDNPVVERWLTAFPDVVTFNKNNEYSAADVEFSAYERYQDGTIVKVNDPDIRYFDGVDEYLNLYENPCPCELIDFGEYRWISDEHQILARTFVNLVTDGKDGKDGKDGTKGDKGDPGLDGKILRVTEWNTGTSYRNDHNPDSNGLRHLDIVSRIGSHWVCKSNHTASSGNAPGTTGGKNYWNEMNSAAPIYTSLLVANQASIRLMNTGEIIVTDKNNNVCGRFGSGDNPLWVGQSEDKAVFRVSSAGRTRFTGTQSGASVIEIDPYSGDMLIKSSSGSTLTRITGKSVTGGGTPVSAGTNLELPIDGNHGLSHHGSNGLSQEREYRVCEFTIPKSASIMGNTVSVYISALIQARAGASKTNAMGVVVRDPASCSYRFRIAELTAPGGSIKEYITNENDDEIALTGSVSATQSEVEENRLDHKEIATFGNNTYSSARYYAVVATVSSRFSLMVAPSVSQLSSSTYFQPSTVYVDLKGGFNIYSATLHRDGLTLQAGTNNYFTAYNTSKGFCVQMENANAPVNATTRRQISGIGIGPYGFVVRVARSGNDNDWITLSSYIDAFVEQKLKDHKLI